MKRYKQNSVVLAASMGDELGMLNQMTGMYFVLDSIGNDVWNILSVKSNIHEIVDTLLGEYDVTKERCEHDIAILLDDMIEKNIIIEV